MEKSLRVAIVDDLTEDSQRLADYLEQFQREHNMEIKMDVYNASFEFLENITATTMLFSGYRDAGKRRPGGCQRNPNQG